MQRTSLFQTLSRRSASAWTRRACVLAAFAALAGCGPDRTVTSSIGDEEDYWVRHPIVMAEAPNTLDVFLAGEGLDRASVDRLREFAAHYRATGEGPILVSMPQNDTTVRSAGATVEAIRRTLASVGAATDIRVSSYPITDPSLASPVHLSFIGLQAKVATHCGEWPEDLASGGTTDGWSNGPYWNFGCSYQSAFAAQVADPRDLVGPRASQPADVAMRTRAIGDVREGKDPGTQWLLKNTSISSVGGQ